MNKMETLTGLFVDLEEQPVLDLIQDLLDQGGSAQKILEALSEGMNVVGDRYSEGEYFLADLVFAAEIFEKAMVILEPAIEAQGGDKREVLGTIVVGTVEGDLHDIGKNIFVALARNSGFRVNDLGIDVPPATFIEHIKKDRADILGMSGILTMAVEPMRRTVEALTEAGLRDRVKVIVGGLPVDERWLKAVGADAGTDNAYEGITLCRTFMEVA
jgi:dimethylamine corrinoid protein